MNFRLTFLSATRAKKRRATITATIEFTVVSSSVYDSSPVTITI